VSLEVGDRRPKSLCRPVVSMKIPPPEASLASVPSSPVSLNRTKSFGIKKLAARSSVSGSNCYKLGRAGPRFPSSMRCYPGVVVSFEIVRGGTSGGGILQTLGRNLGSFSISARRRLAESNPQDLVLRNDGMRLLSGEGCSGNHPFEERGSLLGGKVRSSCLGNKGDSIRACAFVQSIQLVTHDIIDKAKTTEARPSLWRV